MEVGVPAEPAMGSGVPPFSGSAGTAVRRSGPGGGLGRGGGGWAAAAALAESSRGPPSPHRGCSFPPSADRAGARSSARPHLLGVEQPLRDRIPDEVCTAREWLYLCLVVGGQCILW